MPMTFGILQNLGGFEMVLICVVALIVFGNKFPEVARNFGKAFQQFKSGIQEASSQVRRELEQAAAEADPTPEIKSVVGEAMADDHPAPDDYTSVDRSQEYTGDGSQTQDSTIEGSSEAMADATAAYGPDGTPNPEAVDTGPNERSQSDITGDDTSADGAADAVATSSDAPAETASDAVIGSGCEPSVPSETKTENEVAATPPGDMDSPEAKTDVVVSKPVAPKNPDAALLN